MWIADPKAINHILQKSGYLYAKPSDVRERTALLVDRGISWAEGRLFVTHHTQSFPTSSSSNNFTGDVHKRHRRAMAPASGLVEAKGLLPCFMDSVAKVSELCFHPLES